MGRNIFWGPGTPVTDKSSGVATQWFLKWMHAVSDLLNTIPTGSGGIISGAILEHQTAIGSGTNIIAGVSPGAVGTVLTSNGPASNPSYQAVAASASSWIPLVNGSEPDALQVGPSILVTDGAGALILVST